MAARHASVSVGSHRHRLESPHSSPALSARVRRPDVPDVSRSAYIASEAPGYSVMMPKRSALLPIAAVMIGAVLYQAACTDDDSVPRSAPPGQNQIPSGSSGSSNDPPSAQAPPSQTPPPDRDASGPVDVDQEVVCDGGAVPGTSMLDQSQLEENGSIFLTPTTGEPNQSFTPGVTGYLTGIELFVQRSAVGTGPTVGSMQLELRTAGQAVLATSKIPLESFPKGDERGTLSGPPGIGHFSFGSRCLRLNANDVYRFKLTLIDVPDGVCGDQGTCTTGRIGDTCTKHTECDYKIWVSMRNNGNPYDAGALSGFAASDLVFRTYMQP